MLDESAQGELAGRAAGARLLLGQPLHGVTQEVPVPLICYTGDTAPEGLDAEPALYEAKVLITELSFARPDQTPARIHEFGHLHLEDFVERQDRFRNELIIAAHVTTRDDPDEVRRLVETRLPASLGSRIRVWGA